MVMQLVFLAALRRMDGQREGARMEGRGAWADHPSSLPSPPRGFHIWPAELQSTFRGLQKKNSLWCPLVAAQDRAHSSPAAGSAELPVRDSACVGGEAAPPLSSCVHAAC